MMSPARATPVRALLVNEALTLRCLAIRSEEAGAPGERGGCADGDGGQGDGDLEAALAVELGAAVPAASMSRRMMRPFGPLPVTSESESPRCRASRRA